MRKKNCYYVQSLHMYSHLLTCVDGPLFEQTCILVQLPAVSSCMLPGDWHSSEQGAFLHRSRYLLKSQYTEMNFLVVVSWLLHLKVTIHVDSFCRPQVKVVQLLSKQETFGDARQKNTLCTETAPTSSCTAACIR
uniref:Uncharacterized protein n=1 Tax=Sander lucioperca TaxID=283035 RepID=A0A8C9XJ21_SANLU